MDKTHFEGLKSSSKTTKRSCNPVMGQPIVWNIEFLLSTVCMTGLIKDGR